MKKQKPFVFGVATSGDTFTDREDETKRLLNNFEYGINTILISPRRIGKTSLVNKVAELAQAESVLVAKMDIFACRTESDFVDTFSTAVIKATSTKMDEWIQNVKTFFTRFSPKISLSDDPLHDFSVSLEYNEHNHSLEDVLSLPQRIAEARGVQFVVCIDEFQQIGEFQDSLTFQKRLRTVWQHQDNVAYCLYGSKKHLMSTLFLKRNYPFFKFGETLFLNKIPTEKWLPFIQQRFCIGGKNISEELVQQLCSITDNHSSYTQQLAWLLWLQTSDVATEEDLLMARQQLIDECSPLFVQQAEGLTSFQLNFLRAMLAGQKSNFSQKDVIQKYKLGTSANIVRIKNALIKREIIDIADNGHIEFSDPIFKLWFAMQ